MAGLDNTGFRILNPFCFALGIFAPEQIDNRSIKSINPLNPIIRKVCHPSLEWLFGSPSVTVKEALRSNTPCFAQSSKHPFLGIGYPYS